VFCLVGSEFCEVAGRSWYWSSSKCGEPPPYGGIRQSRIDRAIESLDEIGRGTLGAPKPNQSLAWYPGIVSATVGTSGSASIRVEAVTASARNWPALVYLVIAVAVPKKTWIPPAAQVNGLKCVGGIAFMQQVQARYDVQSTGQTYGASNTDRFHNHPVSIRSGRACFTNSGKVLAGNEGSIAVTIGSRATDATGTMPRRTSNLSPPNKNGRH